jgi:antitoxin (DNA-binding transcriptional repressor) of toxin-antitoxin stability system
MVRAVVGSRRVDAKADSASYHSALQATPLSGGSLMGNTAIELTQAPRDLAAAVDEATRSGEVVVTRSGEAVAKVIPLAAAAAARQPGSARGQIHMAEEFDATPEEFVDYL